MISFREFTLKLSPATWKWIGIGFAAFVAVHIYYVQEMIAALIIFSVLFVVVATVVLIIFLMDRVSQQIVVWAERCVTRVVHRFANPANPKDAVSSYQ